jgi:hypothetical protein
MALGYSSLVLEIQKNHDFIMDHHLPLQEFRELIHRLEVKSLPLHPPASKSCNMIILKISPFASFSSYFSLRFKGEPNVEFLVIFGGSTISLHYRSKCYISPTPEKPFSQGLR